MNIKSALIALSGLVMATMPAMAQTTNAISGTTLIKGVDESTLRALVEQSGGTDISTQMIEGQPAIFYTFNNLKYGAYGTACESTYSFRNCKGLMFMASFTVNDTLTAQELNEYNIRWSAAGIHQAEGGSVLVSRYLILDHGQTMDNLILNLNVVAGVAEQLQTELY